MSLPSSMQAIRLTSFVSSLADVRPSTVPFPSTAPTALIIRVTHISPTHVDMLYCRGQHQNNRRHAKPPFVLGLDFAGVIARAPAGGSGFVKGDRVYGSYFGAFAEYISIDAKNGTGSVRQVPTRWTNAEACAVGSSGATSLGCYLSAGGIRKGDWVLVTGASGGLGTIACQIAKVMGAKVIALVGDDEKENILKQYGVDTCVRYTQKGWEQEVIKISGDGVNLVYDAVGMVESSLKCCKYGGKVIIVGFAGRGGKMEEIKVNRILLKSASVLGYRFGEHGRRNPSEVKTIWEQFDQLVNTGSIQSVVYKERYQGLQDVSRALRDLEERKIWGRAVIQVSNEDELAKPRI